MEVHRAKTTVRESGLIASELRQHQGRRATVQGQGEEPRPAFPVQDPAARQIEVDDVGEVARLQRAAQLAPLRFTGPEEAGEVRARARNRRAGMAFFRIMGGDLRSALRDARHPPGVGRRGDRFGADTEARSKQREEI